MSLSDVVFINDPKNKNIPSNAETYSNILIQLGIVNL